MSGLREALAGIARDRAFEVHEAAREAERRALHMNDAPGAPAAKHGPEGEHTNHDVQEDTMTSATHRTEFANDPAGCPDWCTTEGPHVIHDGSWDHHAGDGFDLSTVIRRPLGVIHHAELHLGSCALDAGGLAELAGVLVGLSRDLAELDRAQALEDGEAL